MLDDESRSTLRQAIAKQIGEDRSLLDELRTEIRPLRDQVRLIQPRSTTAISVVAADGGNNQLAFDPFLVQIVRVVDSSNNELCLEVLSPTCSVAELSKRQFAESGSPTTALGRMMQKLGCDSLSQLSPMIRPDTDKQPRSPSWVQVYRELVEWAVLLSVVSERDFGSDTLVIFDGLLRSKVFASDLFQKYRVAMSAAMDVQRKKKRNVFLVGVAKHSKVIQRYRLAMALEGIMRTNYPCYLDVPRDVEQNAYVWSEYARGDDAQLAGGEINKFVAGKMFLLKFGSRSQDPIWPVDVFQTQTADAPKIFGYLLQDAIEGFPVAHYPRSLQKAHENAALVDFDMDILQDLIFDELRRGLGGAHEQFDAFRLQDADPASKRY